MIPQHDGLKAATFEAHKHSTQQWILARNLYIHKASHGTRQTLEKWKETTSKPGFHLYFHSFTCIAFGIMAISTRLIGCVPRGSTLPCQLYPKGPVIAIKITKARQAMSFDPIRPNMSRSTVYRSLRRRLTDTYASLSRTISAADKDSPVSVLSSLETIIQALWSNGPLFAQDIGDNIQFNCEYDPAMPVHVYVSSGSIKKHQATQCSWTCLLYTSPSPRD